MSAQPPFSTADYPPGPPAPPGYPAPAPAQQDLPRRATLPLILLHIGFAFIAVIAPVPLLGTGSRSFSPNQIWMHFREGGFAMWGITLAIFVLGLLLSILGALLIRGRRVPGGVLFLLALLPFGIALLGVLAGDRKITDILAGESIDPVQKARIFAMGISELSNLHVYGGIASSFAMWVTGAAAAMTLLTIDPAQIGPAPKSSAWIIALVLGFLAAIGGAVVRVVLRVPPTGLDALVLFGLLVAGVAAAVAGRCVPTLAAHRNDGDAGYAFRLLFLAACAFAAATLFADRALLAAALREPLGAIAGESVDPSQRARILAAAAADFRGRSIVLLVDTLGCFAVFVAPLLAGFRAKKKFSIAGGITIAFAALTGLLAFLTGSRVDADLALQRAPFDLADQAITAGGVAVPVMREGDVAPELADRVAFLVQRDGTVVDRHLAVDADRPLPIDVAADGALPFDVFMSKLGATLLEGKRTRVVGFVAAPAARHDFKALGPFAGLAGSDLASYRVTLSAKLAGGLPAALKIPGAAWAPSRSASGKVLAVLPHDDAARLVVVSREHPSDVEAVGPKDLPLAGAAGDERRKVLSAIRAGNPGIDAILLAPAPGDTVARVVEILEAISAAGEPSRDELMVTADRATLEEAAPVGFQGGPAGRGSFSVRSELVLGSLGEDAVLRVLRQNGPLFVGCYVGAKNLGGDPPAEVALKFSIEGKGKAVRVKSVKPSAVASCAEKVLGALVFPAPDAASKTLVAVKLQFR